MPGGVPHRRQIDLINIARCQLDESTARLHWVVYLFSIDYSTISHDPHAAQGAGGYVYTPGGHVLAEWTGR